jgi:hypothetical protein
VALTKNLFTVGNAWPKSAFDDLHRVAHDSKKVRGRWSNDKVSRKKIRVHLEFISTGGNQNVRYE